MKLCRSCVKQRMDYKKALYSGPRWQHNFFYGKASDGAGNSKRDWCFPWESRLVLPQPSPPLTLSESHTPPFVAHHYPNLISNLYYTIFILVHIYIFVCMYLCIYTIHYIYYIQKSIYYIFCSCSEYNCILQIHNFILMVFTSFKNYIKICNEQHFI